MGAGRRGGSGPPPSLALTAFCGLEPCSQRMHPEMMEAIGNTESAAIRTLKIRRVNHVQEGMWR
jgi:hypothetical protein